MENNSQGQPKPQVIRESKALVLLGGLAVVFAAGIGYAIATQDFTSATVLLLGSCLVVLLVCAVFFLALYTNFQVRIEPEFAEMRSISRKITRISYADVTQFEQVQLGRVPVLRLVGPNHEVINIDARKYKVDQIIAVLS
ncbi:hypothetical protein V5R04_08765 [Jonesiaceae bacterium BS-20]|uniref:DUF304 domain-containing protein n=1 Tax=Jonesiaceae bacterium BS-20 TaxID=3120821 RepID=A0AAU7DQX8_9MICO